MGESDRRLGELGGNPIALQMTKIQKRPTQISDEVLRPALVSQDWRHLSWRSISLTPCVPPKRGASYCVRWLQQETSQQFKVADWLKGSDRA